MKCFNYSWFVVGCTLLVPISCGGEGGQEAAGIEGGPCYPNGTCNSGFVCLSNLCVNVQNTDNGADIYGIDSNVADSGSGVESACQSSCTGKECGDDGCGGSCGVCSTGQTCNPDNGQCIEATSPKISVTPSNYTFVNATVANPGTATFTITNKGSAPLVIDQMSFKNPTNEFELLNPPNNGTEVLGEALEFQLRYAPVDTPDENTILIKSNDPITPSVGIVVRGETQEGQISITYGDQVAGCMDFQQTITPGSMCTKVVNVANVGSGIVNVKKPLIEQDNTDAYTVEWYESGGMQVGDGNGCGAFEGTPINGPLYGLASQRSLDVAVTYTAPGAQGVNGILVLNYASPTEGKEEIPLCGGLPNN